MNEWIHICLGWSGVNSFNTRCSPSSLSCKQPNKGLTYRLVLHDMARYTWLTWSQKAASLNLTEHVDLSWFCSGVKGSQRIRLNFGQVIVSAGTASEVMHGSKMIPADFGTTKRLVYLAWLKTCCFSVFQKFRGIVSNKVLEKLRNWTGLLLQCIMVPVYIPQKFYCYFCEVSTWRIYFTGRETHIFFLQ